MSDYTFETLVDGGSYPFNYPLNDNLFFSEASVGAADVRLVAVNSGADTQVIMTAGPNAGMSIILQGCQIRNFTYTCTDFADLSRLLVGDTSVITVNDDAGNNLTGTSYGDHIIGLGGDDVMDGGSGGADMFDLMVGANGEYGNDVIIGDGDGSGDWNNHLYLGPTHTQGAVVDLVAGTLTGGAPNSGATFTSIEIVTGTDFADSISGGSFAETLNGAGGNDTLIGEEGSNSLVGGGGNDKFVVINSYDAVYESPGEGGADIVMSSASFTLPVNVEKLTLTGAAEIDGTGNASTNTITGNDAANNVHAGGGADTVNGGLGNDKLWGDAGNDSVSGQAGNDYLWGGTGSDRLLGGGGADRLYWDGATLDALVNGGAGDADTLWLTGTGVMLDLTGVSGTVIKNIEKINLNGVGSDLVMTMGEHVALSASTDKLTVMGGADDSVTATGGWMFDSQVTVGGQVYDRYTHLTHELLVDTDIIATIS